MRKSVYFIHGFDPRGSMVYYEMFKRNLPVGTIISELLGNHFFLNNETEFVFLDWHKLVRGYFSSGLNFIINLIWYYVKFLRHGYRIYKLSKIFLLTGSYPLIILVVYFLPCILLLLHSYFMGAVLFLLECFCLPWVFKFTKASWLSEYLIFHFSIELIEMQNHISKTFKKTIVDDIVLNQETVIVAHSLGVSLIMPMLSNIIVALKPDLASKITLVTFGSCMPIDSLVNKCKAQMQTGFKILAASGIAWHDFTAIYDGICFYKVDIYEELGISNSKMILHSIPFESLFTKERWKKMRWNQLLVHFLYFLKYDYAYNYNFFDMILSSNTREYLSKL